MSNPLTQTLPTAEEGSTAELIRLMVVSAPVAIAVVDATGAIRVANNKLLELFAYDEDELIGQNIELLIPERYRQGHAQYREDYVFGPHVRAMGSGLDLAGRRQDGSEFPIEVGLSYVRLEEDLWVMATVVDITRRKQNEEMLERRVQERTREIERRRQVADTLRDILTILNSDRPLQEILEHIVAQASQLLQADAAIIYQIKDSEEPTVVEASWGLTDGQILQAEQNGILHTVPLVGEVSQPVAITRPLNGDEAGPTYCAQLAVSLKVKEELYGGLVLYYIEPRKFSAEEIDLAMAFGDQAVLAIENARLRAQAARTAVAAERNRIARDLHDSVTQTLFSATLIAEVLPKLVQRDPGEGVRQLEELRQLTRGALAEMRTLLLELRPATLTEVGIEELLRQLVEAARGRARVPIDMQLDCHAPLPPDVKVAFYYVAQEALNNVAKHARAQAVEVRMQTRADFAQLTVKDNGLGFDVPAVTPEHLGLAIMRERTESIGGALDIISSPGAGTVVTLRWNHPNPLPSHEHTGF